MKPSRMGILGLWRGFELMVVVMMMRGEEEAKDVNSGVAPEEDATKASSAMKCENEA